MPEQDQQQHMRDRQAVDDIQRAISMSMRRRAQKVAFNDRFMTSSKDVAAAAVPTDPSRRSMPSEELKETIEDRPE